MGRARPDLIRVLEENPPGPQAGIRLVRRVRDREYVTEIRFRREYLKGGKGGRLRRGAGRRRKQS